MEASNIDNTIKKRLKNECRDRNWIYYDAIQEDGLIYIGYRHFVKEHDNYNKSSKISENEMEEIFEKDYKETKKMVMLISKIYNINYNSLNAGIQNALIDICWMMGQDLIKFEDMFKHLREKEYDKASMQILKSFFYHKGYQSTERAYMDYRMIKTGESYEFSSLEYSNIFPVNHLEIKNKNEMKPKEDIFAFLERFIKNIIDKDLELKSNNFILNRFVEVEQVGDNSSDFEDSFNLQYNSSILSNYNDSSALTSANSGIFRNESYNPNFKIQAINPYLSCSLILIYFIDIVLNDKQNDYTGVLNELHFKLKEFNKKENKKEEILQFNLDVKEIISFLY